MSFVYVLFFQKKRKIVKLNFRKKLTIFFTKCSNSSFTISVVSEVDHETSFCIYVLTQSVNSFFCQTYLIKKGLKLLKLGISRN